MGQIIRANNTCNELNSSPPSWLLQFERFIWKPEEADHQNIRRLYCWPRPRPPRHWCASMAVLSLSLRSVSICVLITVSLAHFPNLIVTLVSVMAFATNLLFLVAVLTYFYPSVLSACVPYPWLTCAHSLIAYCGLCAFCSAVLGRSIWEGF